MSILQHWGQELQNYRKEAGLTQGQFIERLSLLVSQLSASDQEILEKVRIYDEAVIYFGGTLDPPTLSRLEKGTRSLKSRQRCVALVWGLKRIGTLSTIDEANHFLELGGHGNLTSAESAAIFPNTEGVASTEPTSIEPQKVNEKFEATPAQPHMTGNDSQMVQRRPRRLWIVLGAAGVLFALLTIGYLFSQRATTNSAGEQASAIVESNTVEDNAVENNVNSEVTDKVTTHTLLAESLRTEFGEIGRDQTFVNLHELDQTGSSDEWLQHVKFIPVDAPYRGYRSYFVPAYLYLSASPPSVAAMRIETNYRGRGIDGQVWTWRLFNWVDQGWVTVGDNGGAHWWGDWQILTFSTSGRLTNYINPETGEIRLEVQSNDMSDSMDLDYEAIVVTVDQRANAQSADTQTGVLSAQLVEDFEQNEIDGSKWSRQNAPSISLESGRLVWDTPMNEGNEWRAESLEYIGELDKISAISFDVAVAMPEDESDSGSSAEANGALGVSTGCMNDAGWMTVYAGDDPPALFVEFAIDDLTEDGERIDILSIGHGIAYVVELLWVDNVVQVSVDGSTAITVPCNATTYFNLSTSSASGEVVKGSIGHVYVWE